MAQSWPLIVALATKSGIPFTVVSTYRANATTDSGGTSWHALGEAVDFGGHSQDKLAQYFMQFDTLEVIHLSDATGTVYGSQNSKPYAPGSNLQLLQEHRDHLHVAMSVEQAQAALGGGDKNPYLSGVGTALSDAIKTLPNPLDPAASIVDAFRPFAVITSSLTKPQFWRRFGMYVVGTALVGVGIIQFLRRPVGQAVDRLQATTGTLISTGVQGAAFGAGTHLGGGARVANAEVPGRRHVTAATVAGVRPRRAIAGGSSEPVTAVLPPSRGGLPHRHPGNEPLTPVIARAEVRTPRALPNPSRLSSTEAIERMTNPKKRQS